MSTEIILKTGYIRGVTKIIKAKIREVGVRAVLKGAQETGEIVAATVAKKTGAMAKGTEKAIKRSGFRFTVSKRIIHVEGPEVMNLIIGMGPPHTRYHIIQHPDFNKKFAAGYKNSTSGGTPIDMNRVMATYTNRVRSNYKKEFRKAGGNVR